MIRCFLPALLNGKARWGDFPDDLGVVKWDDLEGFERVEQRLNDRTGSEAIEFINPSNNF